MQDEKYNGWANYETWNVALWIGNDESLYDIAKLSKDYWHFRKLIHLSSSTPKGGTPDGVSWYNTKLDIKELDSLIQGFRSMDHAAGAGEKGVEYE